MSNSNDEEFMFFGTYVPWSITKKFENRMAVLNQFRTGWPNFGAAGFFIAVHEDIDKTDPRMLRNDYDAMFSDMMHRVILGFGLRGIRFVTTKDLPEKEIRFRGQGSSRDEIAEVYDIIYYGLYTHDFDNLHLDPRVLSCWYRDSGFSSLTSALPFITVKPGLYIARSKGPEITFEEVG